MSIWDHVKPKAASAPAAVSVEVEDGGRLLRLGWDDGKTTSVTARTLRQLCPCAQCVDEWTHQRTFDPAAIKPDMGIAAKGPVGNYALSFRFSDGHQTGIFTWTFLREASEKNPATASGG